MSRRQLAVSLVLSTALASELAWAAHGRPHGRQHGKKHHLTKQQKWMQLQLEDQATRLRQQQRQLDAQRLDIDATQRELAAQREINVRQAAERAKPPLPAPNPALKPAAGIVAMPANETSSAAPIRAPQQPVKPPEVAALINQPGILTPKGTLVLEPGLQFTHSNSDRVVLIGYTIIPAITVGLIDIRTVTRDATMATLSARYGATNRLELATRIPYIARHDYTATRTLNLGSTRDQIYRQSGKGVGDIEVSARYQLNQPSSGPFYVAGLRIKGRNGSSPFEIDTDKDGFPTKLATGSGFWGTEASLGMIMPSEPAVFFGSISYFNHIKRRYAAGVIDPGDTFSASVGMGIGLNEKASFSVGYGHDVVGKNKLDGAAIPDTLRLQLGTLSFGFAYRTSAKSSLNLSLGVGVTTEAPDIQIGVRMPYGF